MLTARRRFLDAGHFAAVADRLCDLAVSHLSRAALDTGKRARSIVDAGCGEGYYLGMIRSHVLAGGVNPVECLGVDSSREACRLAARRYPDIQFAVSDLKDFIPVAPRSVDLLLDIFAPRSAAEFGRVLADDGLIVVVIPQPDHVQELRGTLPLIGIEMDKGSRVVDRLKPELRLNSRESVRYELSLSPEDVGDLVCMSPSHRHLTAPLQLPSTSTAVTLSVEILTFHRPHEGTCTTSNYNSGYISSRNGSTL